MVINYPKNSNDINNYLSVIYSILSKFIFNKDLNINFKHNISLYKTGIISFIGLDENYTIIYNPDFYKMNSNYIEFYYFECYIINKKGV